MPAARAVKIRGAGGVEVLHIEDIEVREPGPHEVLVEVAAAGLNRADTLQRRGMYPAPPGAPPDIPGLEYAGTVAALGPGVTSTKTGQRVMGIVSGGGMATRVVVHEREIVPVPEGLTLEQAAAVPEVFFTAYDALFLQGKLALGETVLVHAVGSGVGTAALQLAHTAGARVIGTSRTQDKLDRCRELGLVHGVLVEGARFHQAVHEHTGGAGVALVLDVVGAAYLEENVRAMALRGRMVMLGLMGGMAGSLSLGLMLNKRLTVTGSVLRARPLEEKAALAQEFAARVVPLFARGQLAPVVGEVLPMSEIAAAHERMEKNETFGKIVLRW
jgi:putative PIG3 family NAD(P)H quinone oxidoreductase